jgi:hypothetical protein
MRQVFYAQSELEGKKWKKMNSKMVLPATDLHGDVDDGGEGASRPRR